MRVNNLKPLIILALEDSGSLGILKIDEQR